MHNLTLILRLVPLFASDCLLPLAGGGSMQRPVMFGVRAGMGYAATRWFTTSPRSWSMRHHMDFIQLLLVYLPFVEPNPDLDFFASVACSSLELQCLAGLVCTDRYDQRDLTRAMAAARRDELRDYLTPNNHALAELALLNPCDFKYLPGGIPRGGHLLLDMRSIGYFGCSQILVAESLFLDVHPVWLHQVVVEHFAEGSMNLPCGVTSVLNRGNDRWLTRRNEMAAIIPGLRSCTQLTRPDGSTKFLPYPALRSSGWDKRRRIHRHRQNMYRLRHNMYLARAMERRGS
jgi:hypothetical protein